MQPGPSVSLKCSATGNPTPKIAWHLDGFPLPNVSIFKAIEKLMKSKKKLENLAKIKIKVIVKLNNNKKRRRENLWLVKKSGKVCYFLIIIEKTIK